MTSKGTMGTGANSTSNSSYSLTTATTGLSINDWGFLVNVTANTSTTVGDNNEHTSVTDSASNAWVKIAEWTQSAGSAGDGVTVSIWATKATAALNTGSTITMNYTSNRTDKASSAWAFTPAAGVNVLLYGAPEVDTVQSTGNGFGSAAFSGLASVSRLYFRGMSKKVSTTTALTPTTNFTAITNARSRNNANAVCVYGEFRINTSTGETSNPTLAVSGPTSTVFDAFDETTALRYQPVFADVVNEAHTVTEYGDRPPKIQAF